MSGQFDLEGQMRWSGSDNGDAQTIQDKINANNQRIAQLKAERAQLTAEYADDDAYDVALANNRAQAGDISGAMSHLGRIDARRAQAGAKESDNKTMIDDLQYKLINTRRNMAYSTNSKDLQQLADEEVHLEQQIVDRGGKPLGQHIGYNGNSGPAQSATPAETPAATTDTPVANPVSYGSLDEARAWVAQHGVKGKDGVLRLSKSDLDTFNAAIQGIPNADTQSAVAEYAKTLQDAGSAEDYTAAAGRKHDEAVTNHKTATAIYNSYKSLPKDTPSADDKVRYTSWARKRKQLVNEQYNKADKLWPDKYKISSDGLTLEEAK